MTTQHEADLNDEYDLDNDEHYLGRDGEWWPRPAWMHPECVDEICAAENGTCCKYPADDLVARALDLANAIDEALTAFDVPVGGDCRRTAAELARLLPSVPALIADIRPAMTDDNQEVVAQLLCPVGRLTLLVLELSLRSGCPWACTNHGAADRRAELVPLAAALEECQDALFAATAPKPRRRRRA